MTSLDQLHRLWEIVTFRRVEERFESVFRGRLVRSGVYRLTDDERWWRDHAASLRESGYRLRPRFRPRWKPIWLGDDSYQISEDGIKHTIVKVIDVRRISDGRVVAIKQIRRRDKELEIARMLSPSEDRNKTSPSNRCVPILDSFVDLNDPEVEYIVMPLLRRFNDPEFYAVNEVVDFVFQALEGLTFMHSHGIAHGNCSEANMMMDGTPLYPRGFHPSAQDKDVTGLKPVMHLQRSDVDHVNYFFVDFSDAFVNGSTRDDGSEYQTTNIDDHFSADIFCLGQTLRVAFAEKYSNVDFILLLIEDMTQEDSNCRPTSAHALLRFRETAARLQAPTRRLVKIEEHLASTISRDCAYAVRRVTSSPRAFIRNHV